MSTPSAQHQFSEEDARRYAELSKFKAMGFAKLKNSLAHRPGVTNPGALAAYIGRKKFGKKGMAKKSAAGRAKAAKHTEYAELSRTLTRLQQQIQGVRA